MLIPENISAGFSAAMTSLTLPAEPLADFVLNSILEGFSFLLHGKVQPYLAVLQRRNEQRYAQTKTSLADRS